jgi:CrcB protein
VNITGSLFLGWFLAAHTERWQAGEGVSLHAFDVRLLFVVGFAGAYTTFSTFEWESHTMLRDGQGLSAAIYVLASVLAGLIAIRLGMHLARII